MYTEIATNKWKSVGLLLGFLLFVIGFGWLLSAYYGNPSILIVAVVLAVGQAFASYYFADSIALAVSGAQEAPRKEPFITLHREV